MTTASTVATATAPRAKNHLGYLGACFRGYRAHLVGTLICLALARAAATADPLYLKKIIDGLMARQPLEMLGGAIFRASAPVCCSAW